MTVLVVHLKCFIEEEILKCNCNTIAMPRWFPRLEKAVYLAWAYKNILGLNVPKPAINYFLVL